MSLVNNKLPFHFRDFLIVLNRHKVEYLLIGGYALGAFGHIRATADLHIFINATEKNAIKMMSACEQYGIPAEDLKKEMFLVPKMIGIGEPPLRIEILKKLDVVDFQYAFQRSSIIRVDEISINVVGLDDLILLKKAAIKDRNKSRGLEDLTFLEMLKNRLNTKNKIFPSKNFHFQMVINIKSLFFYSSSFSNSLAARR